MEIYGIFGAALLPVAAGGGLYLWMKRRGERLLAQDALEQDWAQACARAKIAAVGQPFPAFCYPGADGSACRLEDFRGEPVLVVHWNPDCEFCRAVAPELARAKRLKAILLAYGSAEANRQLAERYGLHAAIGLLDGGAPPEPLEMLGTPVAYLLDAEGRVARPVAQGADEVAELIRSAAGGWRLRSLTKSRLVRDGLKPGAVAPAFTLPDLNGRLVSLKDYRGSRVLLVFSDPDCGPCEELAPELARWERAHRHEGPAVLMVSRGDPETNRRKALASGIDFPVLLQEHWKLSLQFGIFTTPAAFLIGEDGRIRERVAVGAGPILALARSSVRRAPFRFSALERGSRLEGA
jgi:peroxiredoxin